MANSAPGLDQVLTALRAAGEDTRLRILLLLSYGELSVSELTDILGQSQPRISRHLKQLMEAGIVERLREGAWAFFRLADSHPVLRLLRALLDSLDREDIVVKGDRERFDNARRARARAADEYFSHLAPEWDKVRSLHTSEATVEAAVLELLENRGIWSFLDLGTGTGRMIQLLAPTVSHLAGLDSNHAMLGVARSNLQRAGIGPVDLRQGDIYAPPFPAGIYDLVAMHQVLHYLDDPARAVSEAARLISAGGMLLVVDFAPHSLEFLRDDQKHRHLGFSHDDVIRWMSDAGLECVAIRDLPPPVERPDGLTVTLWLGKDRRIRTDWPLSPSNQGIV
ncbi:MAG: metalloregulator ArsR/SmtB family transcription factor [Methylobacteriaceae bacterium]|jgi:ArsR family transcriptional regulator|nr:metalloregulator ArsR/SmtB family transcription factor [Methylobacteriaceae bacterium]